MLNVVRLSVVAPLIMLRRNKLECFSKKRQEYCKLVRIERSVVFVDKQISNNAAKEKHSSLLACVGGSMAEHKPHIPKVTGSSPPWQGLDRKDQLIKKSFYLWNKNVQEKTYF
jgi:hypothetical protein